jgi:hypothetical protein
MQQFKGEIMLTENNEVAKTRGQLNSTKDYLTKICYVCGERKDLNEFGVNRSRPDGVQTYCVRCAKERQTKWYYKRAHGISLEDRDELLKKQLGKCAICGSDTEFQFKKGRLNNTGEFAVVDHCHESKRIRGVLCGHCNTGLGAFKDNPYFLEAAVKYLLENG